MDGWPAAGLTRLSLPPADRPHRQHEHHEPQQNDHGRLPVPAREPALRLNLHANLRADQDVHGDDRGGSSDDELQQEPEEPHGVFPFATAFPAST